MVGDGRPSGRGGGSDQFRRRVALAGVGATRSGVDLATRLDGWHASLPRMTTWVKLRDRTNPAAAPTASFHRQGRKPPGATNALDDLLLAAPEGATRYKPLEHKQRSDLDWTYRCGASLTRWMERLKNAITVQPVTIPRR